MHDANMIPHETICSMFGLEHRERVWGVVEYRMCTGYSGVVFELPSHLSNYYLVRRLLRIVRNRMWLIDGGE